MAKKDSINKRITDLMNEAFLMPLFFVAGVDALQEKISTMDDADVALIFGNLIPAKAIRKKVEEIQQLLNDSNANIS
ncbi:hypothetical protein CLV62_15218 [Dysgonomonas alginatilytica]|uniref:Uncharacterized protein n=1 Tax=Dysgonomonas alginatilytica TaxID=1605892 RepID=A0A2V3PI87_9BACT|nr:hypothetical protein [Dysgonomonas alginatilytica]PXV57434.1 hypothetical protein CLV62_15218 [Dysgonomonas alginatilytica]